MKKRLLIKQFSSTALVVCRVANLQKEFKYVVNKTTASTKKRAKNQAGQKPIGYEKEKKPVDSKSSLFHLLFGQMNSVI